MRGVSVKWFGAQGDGETDDTQAFQDAIAEALRRQEGNEKISKPTDGGLVVYVPPGLYIVEVEVPSRINFIGEKNQSCLMACTDGHFALTYSDLWVYSRWQRPFIHNLTFQGTTAGTGAESDRYSRSRSGIDIRNHYGVDLIDVNCWRCVVGIKSSENFYGTWDRLKITECETGVWLTKNLNGAQAQHTGNKRLIDPLFRLNGIGMRMDYDVTRTAIYGGTIEANRTGVVMDRERTPSWWSDALGVKFYDTWFEANLHFSDFGPDTYLADGILVENADIFLYAGSMALDNCGVEHAYIKPKGRLNLFGGSIGSGPTTSFLSIDPGGYFKHSRNAVVPNQMFSAEYTDDSLGSGPTSQRPTSIADYRGRMFYDTDLNLPLWSDGTKWRDGAGNGV